VRLGPLHVALALVVSVFVNAILLFVLASPPPAEARQASREPPDVPFPTVTLPPERPPPPEPRRPIETPESARPAAARAEVRAPNLPSAFEDPSVGPLEAEVGALRQAVGSGTEDARGNETAREAHAVEQPPRVRSRRLPRFPAKAEAEGTEGHVVLRILIDRSGQVEAVRVVSAQPPGVFEEAATAAIRGWRFAPARDGGRPVPVWARKTLRFELR
jgi:periplasmic protein TonB